MSADERAARAEKRRRAAYGIVRELDLPGRWGKYGEVVIVGSVGIGVVVQPDIDLEIHSDEPRVADGFAVMAALAELPKARRGSGRVATGFIRRCWMPASAATRSLGDRNIYERTSWMPRRG